MRLGLPRVPGLELEGTVRVQSEAESVTHGRALWVLAHQGLPDRLGLAESLEGAVPLTDGTVRVCEISLGQGQVITIVDDAGIFSGEPFANFEARSSCAAASCLRFMPE